MHRYFIYRKNKISLFTISYFNVNVKSSFTTKHNSNYIDLNFLPYSLLYLAANLPSLFIVSYLRTTESALQPDALPELIIADLLSIPANGRATISQLAEHIVSVLVRNISNSVKTNWVS